MPTEADLLRSTYYTYGKPKPFLRRLVSWGQAWPAYCEQCAAPVAINSLVMGVSIPEASLKAPNESAVVQRLRQKDWSVLRYAKRPTDWNRDPNLRIELGRCERCAGPFCSTGKVQGVGANTLLFGAVFLGELNTLETIALLESALESDLFGSDSYLAKGVATCKAIGGSMNFDKFTADRETRRAALQVAHRAMLDLQQEKLQQASDGLHSALQTFSALGNKMDQSATLMNLGIVQIKIGNFDEAELQLRRSLVLAEETSNGLAATCFGLLGTVERHRGALDRAESMFRQALQAESDADNVDGMARAHYQLGGLYETREMYSQARDAYSTALELWQKVGEKQNAVSASEALSRLPR